MLQGPLELLGYDLMLERLILVASSYHYFCCKLQTGDSNALLDCHIV